MDNVQRKIHKIWKNKPTIEGAGVHLKRVFGFHELPLLDPFLLLDDFRSENPEEYKAGFPWHPHRGIETITYVLEGDVEHGDSIGNKGNISSGDVQWMTAGSGIIHQEMPKGNYKGEMLGFQLWANLPAHSKMIHPRYQEIKSHTIPQIKTEDGASIRVICGQINGTQGPAKNIISNPEYLDITLPANKSFTHVVKPNHNVIAYVIDGEAYFDEHRVPYALDVEANNYFDMTYPCSFGNGTLILYERQGSHIVITTTNNLVRFLLMSGMPLNESIAWYGPIVMNTHAELQTAFKEYQNGTFIKHDI